MSSTSRRKELLRRMRMRFGMAALICFAVITILSLMFYLVYSHVPVWEMSSQDSRVEALIEDIDAIKMGSNSQKDLEQMNSMYR